MEEDVGRGVQVAEGVTADKSTIFCEADIALQYSRTHASSCHSGLNSLLGELESSASTMPNGELRDLLHIVLATNERIFQRPIRHIVDDIVWSFTNIDTVGDRVLGTFPWQSCTRLCQKSYNNQIDERTHDEQIEQ